MTIDAQRPPNVRPIWATENYYFDGWGEGKFVSFPSIRGYIKIGCLWEDDAGTNVVFRCDFCLRKSILKPGNFSCHCGGADKLP